MVYRAPIADRKRRASLPAEERFFWSVVISVIISSVVAFGLAAVSLYSLGLLLACDIALAAVVAVVFRGGLRLDHSAPRLRWTAVLPAALVAIGGWMYFAVPASEYVLGGRDPGVYMSEGIQIAQRRSLVTTEPVVASIPPATRDLFYPYYGAAWLLQRPVHGLPPARSRGRDRERSVSAGIPSLDRDRLRHRRPHRDPACDRLVGHPRCARSVFCRSAPHRSGCCGCGCRAPCRPRDSDVVRAVSEFGDRHTSAPVCRPPRTRVRARRRGQVLWPRRGLIAGPRTVHSTSSRSGSGCGRCGLFARAGKWPSSPRRIPDHVDRVDRGGGHVLHNASSTVLQQRGHFPAHRNNSPVAADGMCRGHLHFAVGYPQAACRCSDAKVAADLADRRGDHGGDLIVCSSDSLWAPWLRKTLSPCGHLHACI